MTAPDGLRAGEAGRFRVEGALTIESARDVLESGIGLLPVDAGTVEIDLAGLTAFDSAALGVMFEWQRRTAGRGLRIRYANLPPKLATLARLYGVDTLLAASADA
ncbi:MAG: lipid asymmetry maintenance protein MlaB [bacterium]|nr:STAS domain-containing protein [Betaproteobacteria bacterium]